MIGWLLAERSFVSVDASSSAGDILGAQRFKEGSPNTGPWVPPIVLPVSNGHGSYALALGRRKWTVPGGYPTLSHGGLTVLETLSPFVQLSR